MCGNPVSDITRGALDVMTFGTAEIGGISKKAGDTVGGLTDTMFGDGPDLPAYPGLTADETAILKKQGITADQLNELLQSDIKSIQANRQILQGVTGLFNEDGSINQNALDDTRTRVKNQISKQETVGEKGLDYMSSFFDTNAGPLMGEITAAAQQRYLRALKGELPASSATVNQFKDRFAQLKEAAATRGIKIEGDDWNTATSTSTAGVRMIAEFQRSYNENVESQNNNELSRGANTLGLIQNIGISNFNAAAGVAGNTGANNPMLQVLGSLSTSGASLAPVLSMTDNAYGGIMNTLRSVDLGQYQQRTAQVQADYQANQQLFQTIGMLTGQLGSAALMGRPSVPYVPTNAPVMKYQPTSGNNAYAGEAA